MTKPQYTPHDDANDTMKKKIRVRTILVLGYWVLGNIHRYWVVLLLGDILCCSDTQYNTNQIAVSTVCRPVNDYLVPLVTCTLTDVTDVCLDIMMICCCLLNTITVIIMEFWDFLWSLLCYALVSVLGIGIARGQYYWVLDIGIVLTLKNSNTMTTYNLQGQRRIAKSTTTTTTTATHEQLITLTESRANHDSVSGTIVSARVAGS